MIAVACDHAAAGEYKQKIIDLIENLGLEARDFGCSVDDGSVDYYDYCKLATDAVLQSKGSFGILICGTGIGMSIAANRNKGIRCALCTTVEQAKLTREHNDANFLALGARVTPIELALKIVKTFLQTGFSFDERHIRRIQKIS